MKKKTLLFGAALMLTAMFFTTSCKDAVENALSANCYTCTHTDPAFDTANDICDIAGIDQTSYYTTLGYNCTKN